MLKKALKIAAWGMLIFVSVTGSAVFGMIIGLLIPTK